MIQKMKNKLVLIAAIFSLAAPALLGATAAAATDYTSGNLQGSLCNGTQLNVSDANGTGASDCGTGANADSINSLLQKAVNIISGVVGVIAVIMIVVGGFKYITSGGESSNVSGAKNTIIYAIIGLVIVALAQIIVHFVINQTSTIT